MYLLKLASMVQDLSLTTPLAPSINDIDGTMQTNTTCSIMVFVETGRLFVKTEPSLFTNNSIVSWTRTNVCSVGSNQCIYYASDFCHYVQYSPIIFSNFKHQYA